MKLYEYEQALIDKGYQLIAGTDEVGRGPLAGPVVAAACILPLGYQLEGLDDSKKLTDKKRDVLYEQIIKDAIAYSVVFIGEEEIDRINIYQASKQAMMQAIAELEVAPDYVLIDAMPIEELLIDNLSIIKGDAKSLSIAAASVIAKVTRDRYMISLGEIYPEYGFEKHKGYPTKQHIDAIHQFGILDIHRKTFQPIKDLLKPKLF